MIYLNPEQDKLVRLDSRGHLLIRGVAGSGKTTVALYRAKYLSENYLDMFTANKILVLTYNRTLVAFMRGQAKELGLEGVEISSFHQWAGNYLNQRGISINKVLNSGDEERRAILKKACSEAQRRFENRPILNWNPFFFEKEIAWMKGSRILDIETYLDVERQGRRGRLNAEDRKVVFAVFEQYKFEMMQKQWFDYEDFALLALRALEDDDSSQYTHIVVDEAQDLSQAELSVITKLVDSQTNSITLLTDAAQKIYDNGFTWKGVGINIQGRSHTLNKNFRTTVEIAEAAYTLLEKDTDFVQNSEDYVKPEQINKDQHGCYPIYRRFGSLEEGTDYVVEEIKRLKEQTTCELSEMVILHPQQKFLRVIQERLNVHQIPNYIVTPKGFNHEAEEVKLCTMHSIKGLEARVVFILGLDEGNLPNAPPSSDIEAITQERKLLYVGMTRAKEWLYLISGRNPSRYLGEIDRRFLRLSSFYRLRPFYAIPPEEYLFQQLVSDDSPEERVRQWLLRELIESYGFPKELFDGRTVNIEVPITIGSRQCFVDVAIQKEFQGDPKPLVLFEVKRLDSTEGIDQLHGYLSACPTARIGVWTNGCELKCFIKNGDQIEPRPDIPVYNEATFG
jgi:superfamily I DNA/RNA helicase